MKKLLFSLLALCLSVCAMAVSVTDFGADPTGNADSSEAFNKAIAAAHASDAVTRLVKVPGGTYLIDGPVELGDGIYLKGEGKKAVTVNILKHDFSPFSMRHGCRIEGMTFSYPNNQETIHPKKAEPTILLLGANPEVVDVGFGGAWTCIATPEGVETNAGGGLFRDIFGWSHYRGISISGAMDINKFENIHWFVGGTTVSDQAFYAKNRVCFEFGRQDGVMMTQCFTILSKTFYQQKPTVKVDGKNETAHSLPHFISNCWIEHVKNGFIFEGNTGFAIDSCQILTYPGGVGIDVECDMIFYNASVTSTQVRCTGGGNLIGLIYAPKKSHPRTKLSVSDFQVVDGYPAVKIGKNARNFTMLGSHLLASGGVFIEDGADKLMICNNIIDYWPGGYSIKNNNKPGDTVIIKDNIQHKIKEF